MLKLIIPPFPEHMILRDLPKDAVDAIARIPPDVIEAIPADEPMMALKYASSLVNHEAHGSPYRAAVVTGLSMYAVAMAYSEKRPTSLDQVVTDFLSSLGRLTHQKVARQTLAQIELMIAGSTSDADTMGAVLAWAKKACAEAPERLHARWTDEARRMAQPTA